MPSQNIDPSKDPLDSHMPVVTGRATPTAGVGADDDPLYDGGADLGFGWRVRAGPVRFRRIAGRIAAPLSVVGA